MAEAHPLMPTSTVTPPPFAELIDLAGARLGGRALCASDEFFAGKENLLNPERAIFIPGKYTDLGKWMDGWESRRKRVPGHDWCIIALGRAGAISGVNVDTGWFRGNQPEACTVEAAELPGDPTATDAARPWVSWTPIIDRATLKPDSEHFIKAVPAVRARRFTHVRLNIFPDGGVARFRVHGTVMPDWRVLAAGGPVDLAAAENGGLVIAASDMHFGSRHNLIMPGRAPNMGDGWETRRKRGLTWTDGRPNEYDWCVVRLGHRGRVQRIEVDTNHFKGNFPESAAIDVCDAGAVTATFDPAGASWRPLLPRSTLRASALHLFDRELDQAGTGAPVTHVRLRIFPDGGVSRLRVWGAVAE